MILWLVKILTQEFHEVNYLKLAAACRPLDLLFWPV